MMRVTSAGGTYWDDEGDVSRWYLLNREDEGDVSCCVYFLHSGISH